MDNISRLILDDSGYLPKLQNIAEQWNAVADAEENALQAGDDAIQKRVESLDVLDQGFVKSMTTVKQAQAADESHAKAITLSAKASTAYGKVVDKVGGVLGKWKTKVMNLRKSEKQLTAAKREQIAVFNKSKQAFASAASQVTILGTSMGALWGAIKAAIGVGRAFIGVLGAFRVALIATGVGAFVVILGSLITYLKNTVEGQDFLNRKLAMLGAVVASVKDVVIKFGKAVFDAVSNPLQAIKNFGKGVTEFLFNPAKKALELWNRLKGEVQEIAADVVNDATAAEALARREQILRDKVRGMAVETAKVRAEAEKLRAVGADVNADLETRSSALQEAYDKETALMAQQIDLAQENLDIINAKNNLATSLNEDLDAAKDAEVELLNLQKRSLAKQRALTTQLAALKKEAHTKFMANQKAELKALEDLKKKYQEISVSILDAVYEVELAQATPIENIKMREDKALEEITKSRENFMATSKAALLAGLITQEDIDSMLSNLDILEAAIKQEFGRERDLGTLPAEAVVKLDIKKVDVPKKQAAKTAEEMGQAMADPIKKSFVDAVQGGLDDAVNFLDDNKDKLDAFKGFFNDLTSIFTSGIDAQISKIDELIAANDEKIETLEGQIDSEKDAKEKGLAGNLGLLEKELADEKAQREKSIAEKQALEKKARTAQLINDTLQQSSSLITSSANIFKAMSSIPFVGVPLAIGFIATMFGAFAKAKIDASKASKLFKGTGKLSDNFKTFSGHKSDLYGNGYSVVDSDTREDMGIQISGKEPLINEAVGQGVNRGFFEELNRNPNVWRNFDIHKAIRNGKASVGSVKTIIREADSVTAERAVASTPSTTVKDKPFVQFINGEPTHKITIKNGVLDVEQL